MYLNYQNKRKYGKSKGSGQRQVAGSAQPDNLQGGVNVCTACTQWEGR
jgi:hypothetical protein